MDATVASVSSSFSTYFTSTFTNADEGDGVTK